MGYSCSAHLARASQFHGTHPHYRVVVSPAGAGEKCDFCKRKANWTVNPE